MSITAALLIAVASPQAGAVPQAGTQVTSARASARIVHSVRVRQGREIASGQPRFQISRDADGAALIEFL